MPTFISHSFKDEALYSTLCLALDSAEITRWDPESMAVGEALAAQLQHAIQVCEVCVFVATRRSIESPWCLAELGAFWGAGKRVLMFMADPDLAESTLPPQFKGTLRANTASSLISAIRGAYKEFGQDRKEGKGSSEGFNCKVIRLDSRQAVYQKAAELIAMGTHILDATWGSDAVDLSEAESRALKAYLGAKASTISRDHTDYREIFTLTEGNEREERIQEALTLTREANYRAKLMKGISHDFPMLDFMVVDRNHTILSFLSSSTAHQSHRYLYLQSEDIAKHLTEYFDECWRVASKLTPSTSASRSAN